MKDEDATSIRISIKTRDKVAQLGTTADTFDVVIDRLADFWIRYKNVVDQTK